MTEVRKHRQPATCWDITQVTRVNLYTERRNTAVGADTHMTREFSTHTGFQFSSQGDAGVYLGLIAAFIHADVIFYDIYSPDVYHVEPLSFNTLLTFVYKLLPLLCFE